jgi:hypothetical protein
MSEIPFVNQLGDELESAARRSPAPRRRRRRFTIFAITGAIALSGTAVATGLFSNDAEQQATNPVSCYGIADASVGPVTWDSAPDTSEIGKLSVVELCRRELARGGTPVSHLVACSARANVAVIPGRAAADCIAAGFKPLSATYARAQHRTVRLERGLLRIETSADCIPAALLVRRAQALLDRSGWTGWSVIVRGSRTHGPCGTLSNLNGGGQRTFGGSYDAAARHIIVWRSASRRIMDLLYSDHGLMGPLFADSGARCFTVAQLRAHAKAVFAAKHVDVTVRAKKYALVPGSLDDDDGRWTRYQQGCAIVSDSSPGSNDHSVTIDAWLRP